MRPYRWLLAVLALIMLAAGSPVAAQGRAPKNNVVIADLDADTYPKDLLSEEEVAKIERLQSGATFIAPYSPVSPDDQAIFVIAGENFGFLNLSDGRIARLDPERFGFLIPLPLLSSASFPFSWVDDRTLGALALNFLASSPEELFAIMLIDRVTLEIGAVPVRLPSDTSLVSASPNFQNYVLVKVPEELEETAGSEGAFSKSRVQLSLPTATLRSEAQFRLPATFQRKVDRLLREKPRLAQRALFTLQDEADGEIEVTNNTLDLLRYNAANGELGYITTVPEASSLFSTVWSPDSRRVALSFISLSDPDSPRDTFDGSLISEMLYRDVTGNLPPSENPILQGNNTYVVDFGSGATQILRSQESGARPMLFADAFSPDNSTLLVQAWHPARIQGRTHPIYAPQFIERASFRFYNGALQETARFELPLFSAAAYSGPSGIFLSPDELIVLGVSGTDRHPYYYNRVSGELRNIADRAGTYYNIFSTNRSRQLVFTHTSFTSPADIYRMGWDGKGLARLTWLNEELRQEANLAEYPVSFRLRNGQTRVGVLIQPADAPYPPKNRPLIVWQEGGPGVPMNGQWLTNVENPYALLPSFGYSLLVVPLSGRPGYTPQVFNALADRGNFGAIDIDELAEITNQAISRGWTSRGKIGITGCSYGGYFTWQSIIRHPDLYTAANPQCALVDTITEWTRGYPTLMAYLEGLPPYNNSAEYRADSPAYNAAKVKTPVLTFHGSNDFLPVVQNENLHLQLFNRGVPVRMVKFIGEGHGLGTAENQLYAAQEQINWFRTYLK